MRQETGLRESGVGEILKSRSGSFEVTALGMIVSLIVACCPLVSDGTLRLSDYLVFVAFLLIAAAALVWRIVNLAPARSAESRQ
jgi:hypothetical protein